MTAQRSVQVVGGGIIGLTSALSLREQGFDVTLRDDAAECPPASWGNAGHIAVEQIDPAASWSTVLQTPRQLMLVGGPVSFPPAAIRTWLPFALRLLAASSPARFARGKAALGALLGAALPAWRERVARIGRPELLRETGHIVVWESVASAARGRRLLTKPVSASVSCHDLTTRQAELLKATVSRPIVDAMRYEGTASVADPGAVLDALREGFLRAGGRIEVGAVATDFVSRLQSDLIIIAAGVRSAPLMEALGHNVPIIAERGYHIQSASAPWPNDLPPVVFEDRALVVNGFASGLRASSFTEFTRHASPPDPRKWDRLRRHVAELGLHFGSDTSIWHGSRPTFPDYLPAIGRSSKDQRVLYAFGHQHLGLTLAAVTAEIIASLAAGNRPTIDPRPFAIERFAS